MVEKVNKNQTCHILCGKHGAVEDCECVFVSTVDNVAQYKCDFIVLASAHKPNGQACPCSLNPPLRNTFQHLFYAGPLGLRNGTSSFRKPLIPAMKHSHHSAAIRKSFNFNLTVKGFDEVASF